MAHPAEQLRALDAGQHYVQHHQLRPAALYRLPEAVAVGEALGVQPGGAQSVQLNVADAGIVLHTPDHVGILLSCYFGFVYAGDGKLHPFGDIRGVISYTLIILCDHQ